MSTSTSPTPAASFPTTVPPVGSVSGTCCPKFAGVPKYHGAANPSQSTWSSRRGWTVESTLKAPTSFGWDDRTNLPAQADRGTDEYWNRSGAPGAPSGRRDKDGSVWVGVKVNQTAQIDLRFVGQAGLPCIGNVSVDIGNTSVATVLPTSYTTPTTVLSVKGQGAGETTVTLKCNGKAIGWFHVICHTAKTAALKVFRVNLKDAAGADLTPATAFTAANITAIKRDMDNVYNQAGITWTISNGGVISYTTTQSVSIFNSTLGANTAPTRAQFRNLLTDFQANLPTGTAASSTGARHLFFFEGPSSYRKSGGRANGMPSNDCIVYAPWSGNWGRLILVHEVGHNVGLYHPSDSNSTPNQLPDNFRLPLVSSGGSSQNCMFSDHHNVMGYGCDQPPGSAIRLLQWKAARQNV